MAKKPQPVVMRAREPKLVVKVGKVAIGHQAHVSGAGVHDNRPKRQRTRSAQRLSWKKEWL